MLAHMDELKNLTFDRKFYEDRITATFPRIAEIMGGKPVVIYGAARMGRLFKENLVKNNIKIAAFIDTNPDLWGRLIESIKVISPEEAKAEYFENPILVASLLHETEIYETLKKMGFPLAYPLSFLNFKYPGIFISPEYHQQFDSLFEAESQSEIIETGHLMADEESKRVLYNLIKFRLTFDKNCLKKIKSKGIQYFPPDIMSLSDEEVFFDCGAYTGDTVEQFNGVVSGKFHRVYSFEPDRGNFNTLKKVADKIDHNRVLPIQSGVYSFTGEIKFTENGSLDTRIANTESAISLPVINIDNFIKDKETPTYIKMDIEGSEAEALNGAKETIKKYKPKLAISVYHKATDLWKLPLLINSLRSDYALYLRHYTDEIVDTVCYAI